MGLDFWSGTVRPQIGLSHTQRLFPDTEARFDLVVTQGCSYSSCASSTLFGLPLGMPLQERLSRPEFLTKRGIVKVNTLMTTVLKFVAFDLLHILLVLVLQD